MDTILVVLLCAYCWWCGYQTGATRYLQRAIKLINEDIEAVTNGRSRNDT